MPGTLQSSVTPASKASGSQQPARAPAAAGGHYRIQVASVRNRAEAEKLARRIQQENQKALTGRKTDVVESIVGNMGKLYQVKIGPFADASEPRALCAKLRGQGLDCMMMTQ